jgi:hypothetical protein
VVLNELSTTDSMAPKRPFQQLSEFDEIWLAKCKTNRGHSFQQRREASWKEFEREMSMKQTFAKSFFQKTS